MYGIGIYHHLTCAIFLFAERGDEKIQPQAYIQGKALSVDLWCISLQSMRFSRGRLLCAPKLHNEIHRCINSKMLCYLKNSYDMMKLVVSVGYISWCRSSLHASFKSLLPDHSVQVLTVGIVLQFLE